jgi:hypothetical protein
LAAENNDKETYLKTKTRAKRRKIKNLIHLKRKVFLIESFPLSPFSGLKFDLKSSVKLPKALCSGKLLPRVSLFTALTSDAYTFLLFRSTWMVLLVFSLFYVTREKENVFVSAFSLFRHHHHHRLP